MLNKTTALSEVFQTPPVSMGPAGYSPSLMIQSFSMYFNMNLQPVQT